MGKMQSLVAAVDRLLAQVEVRGDSVLILADSRRALREIFLMLPAEEETEEGGGASGD